MQSLFTVPLPHGSRLVRVHVPDARPAGPSPVLLLFDGQNVFGDAPSFAGGWHADEAVQRLPSTVRRPIVVGLDNGGERRTHELWAGLDEVLDRVMKDVMPEVASRWEVDPKWVIGGASLGGLAALAAHWRNPDQFRGALCLSPSFWVAGDLLHAEIAGKARPGESKVYIDAGAREGLALRQHAERFVTTLATQGYSDKELMWKLDRRGAHRERDWARRLSGALKWMFRKS